MIRSSKDNYDNKQSSVLSLKHTTDYNVLMSGSGQEVDSLFIDFTVNVSLSMMSAHRYKSREEELFYIF